MSDNPNIPDSSEIPEATETPGSIKLSRDIDATLVPFGSKIFLPAGTEVIITQALGGTFTVISNGQMVRIAGKDADAIGKPIPFDDIIHNQDLSLEDKVWAMLHTCYDPEIPVNIVDLGLIYSVNVEPTEDNKNHVLIKMTLTAPGCGMGPILADEAKEKVLSLPGIKEVQIEIVFDPPWDRSMMSDQAKLQLGMMW